jgi:predicted DNA-binding ribbon-helix-helix protein
MNCEASIETRVDCIVSDVRSVYVSREMEVNWIATKFESLTNIGELNVLNLATNFTISGRKHNVCSVLRVWCSVWVTTEDNIP